jgi:UDP-glucose 4-epimerase
VLKILIIGGAGYIGSHVTRAFLDRKDKITVFDNLSSGCRENLFEEAEFVLGDILDYNSLCNVMAKGFDVVVHLAALKAAGESMTKPEKYAINNICGTINIINAMAHTNIKNIIFSSSASVYGMPKYIPVDENHPLEPINFYGYTKLEIENLLKWYDKLKNIRFASLRYFNAAGYDINGKIKGLERNPQNLLPIVMETACGIRKEMFIFGDDYDTKDGTGIRDYIHVNDLAVAHILACKYVIKNNKSIIVNLGSEKGLSVKEIIAMAEKITKRKINAIVTQRRLGDPAIMLASSKKAKEILGWEPKYSDCETLIKSMWDVYKNKTVNNE